MTDHTDQDRSAYEWAQMAADNNADPSDAPWRIVARHYLATVEAPATTLAEELRELGALLEEEGGAGAKSTVWARDLAARVEKIEQENQEQREWNLAVNEQAGILTRERNEARAEVIRQREIIRKHKERADRIAGERDEALAIIETADWRHWFRDNQNLIAEVERLTAERDRIASGRHITYAEVDGKPVQRGAESNAETPDPADVKQGEAWTVEVDGERRTAVKDDDSVPWNTVTAGGILSSATNAEVTLITRLVPAPRVIADPDELAEVTGFAIGMTARTEEAWQLGLYGWHSPNRTDKFTSKDIIDRFGPMTILYEPEVTA